MITRLVIDGVLKLAQVCKYSNNANRVAKIFNPREAIPEAVLNEISANVFEDEVNHKLFELTPTGLTPYLGF